MTAEAAVLNKSAVALAADSAVTVGQEGQEKIFNNANKLFALSHHHPAGIMFYGSADITGVPIDTIVKLFRTTIPSSGKERITDYAESFIDFLDHPKFQDKDQDVIGTALGMIPLYESILTSAERRSKGKREFGRNLKDEIEQCYDHVSHIRMMSDYQDITLPIFRSIYSSSVDLAVNTVFKNIRITKDNRKLLERCGYHACVSEYSGGGATGIVIAGFGEDEWFTSLRHIVIAGRICGKIKRFDISDVDIGRASPSGHIMAFAQNRTVSRFMDGVDPLYRRFIMQWLRKQLQNFAGEILEEHTNQSEEERKVTLHLIRDSANAVIDQLRDDLETFSRDRFSGPIVRVVNNSPKEELAHLAEALVSISSLERKVSGSNETVGGPIDVAVISKGRWVSLDTAQALFFS